MGRTLLRAGKSAVLQPLYGLLCLCWREGAIPQDIRDASIVTLYKNNGDRSDCNNYRGISLLSIVGKVFARILLTRLQTLTARVPMRLQGGFSAPTSEEVQRAGQATVSSRIGSCSSAFAISLHTEEAMQRLMDRVDRACKEFGLMISLKKTNFSAQVASHAPSISISDYTLEVTEDFMYLGSTIATSQSLDIEINRWIGKASATMAKLSKRVLDNKKLTENTKMRQALSCTAPKHGPPMRGKNAV
ncbi:uncharacterized protein LOC124285103 [Haliotis rubra]|uniref:uncharacterized protein LOC124285103 n=1 Tax=Haliotis rubra TaxID=36100 RepID=UPI001EE62A11|nr:uncharacterized protein LOC124285103 [Haliotis rubra]